MPDSRALKMMMKSMPKKKMMMPEKKTMPDKSMGKLGSGERFAALKTKMAQKKGVTNPGALAAWIGRKKFGSTKFAKLSAKGR